MGRVIKFRAWHPNIQTMVTGDDVGIVDEDLLNRVFTRGSRVLMQFTGLTNYEGVEIYEGDILQDQYGKAAIVSWFPSSVRFELLDIEEASMNGLDTEEPAYIIDDSEGWVDLKVIGNIYQNPELLPQC